MRDEKHETSPRESRKALNDLSFGTTVCPQCSRLTGIDDACFEAFFHSRDVVCCACQTRLDLWETLKRNLEPPLRSFGWHYALLDCRGRMTEILMKPHKTYQLDLSKEIGEGELLYINYTPQGGGLFPIQWHGNVPALYALPKTIALIPHGPSSAKETKVGVFYWFAPKQVMDDLATMLLLDAFRDFYHAAYRHMCISAQTSVEILQYRFFESTLQRAAVSRTRARDFLEDRATFSVQLFTLLPFLAKIQKFPMLDSRIIGGLRTLVKTRNDVIHRGKPKKAWDEDEVAKSLLGAFFALKYFKIVHRVQLGGLES